ncbi:MAG: hypothetical protein EXS08_16380 [Planctomycetes bacterium]|nr:hypothetical protein [Planctomycetota bacterium]
MGCYLTLRRLAHGACAGALLSCMRAPLGLDWTQLAVVQASSAALFRAGALLALALALDPARRALREGPRGAWLGALWAGFAVHGLVLDVTPDSRAGYALTLVVGTFLLRTLAGSRTADGPVPEVLGRGERLGLVLCGLGAACAFESLARETRLFGMATRADDALFASVFLALLFVAALSFGPLLSKLGGERVRFATGLALSTGVAVAGLTFLAQLSPGGLHGYLRRFGLFVGWGRVVDGKLGGALGLAGLPALDGASIGTLWSDALLGAAAFVVPCFVLGATLGATRHSGRAAHALVGAALGLVLLPLVIRAHGHALTPAELGQASFAWDLVVLGASVAALGLVLACVGEARLRLPSVGLALAVALVPWAQPRLALWSFSPWAPSVVEPELVWPTPEGLLTVERARDGTPIATLDRRRLTPLLDEQGADERRLRRAFELLPPARRTRAVRTLFVGQLTPARARVLRALGALELERTAPWHLAMPAVEERLFAGEEAPPGRIVAPAEARTRLSEGGYDWVIAPSIRGPVVNWKSEARELWGSGDAPRLSELELANETLGVAWLDADSLAERGAALEPLLLELELLDSFSLALVRGADANLAPEACAAIADQQCPRPLDFLRTMPQLRAFALQRDWAASLSYRTAPELVRGLTLHFGAQRLSSGGESRAQQIELDEEALRAFFAAVPAADKLDVPTRELWEALAWMFTAKRFPEEALVYLEPVAERFAPWPALDRAVAHAYREVLEPATALRFLARAREAEPGAVEAWIESSQAAAELGDGAQRVAFLERALAVSQGRPDVERELGLALLAVGDERGRAIAERYLSVAPDDLELLQALGRSAPEKAPADER